MIRIVLIAALAASDAPPAPAFFAPNEELRGYLMEAANNNPALHARHAEWLAALEKAPQVTSLEDPMLMLGYGESLRTDMRDFEAALSQKFPWFGARRAKGEKAAAEAEATLARFCAERNRVFAEVKQAYFEYAYLAESIRVTESQADILGYMASIIETKYALGLANQDEVLRIQMEQSKLDDRRAGLVQSRAALSAALSRALGREPVEDLPWPQEAASPPGPPPMDEILTRLRVHPNIRELGHLVESFRKQARIAKKEGFPSLTVEVEYNYTDNPREKPPDPTLPESLEAAQNLLMVVQNSGNENLRVLQQAAGGQPMTKAAGGQSMTASSTGMSGAPGSLPSAFASLDKPADDDKDEDALMVRVNMNLPIWRKRVKAGIREAQHMEKAAQHDQRRVAQELEAAARTACVNIQDALRRHALYKDSLLPRARQTYETLQVSYAATAGASFLDLLDSVHKLLDYELEQARAFFDLQISTTELELLTGGTWAEQAPADSAPDATPTHP